MAWVPECAPPTLISRSPDDMRAFMAEHGSFDISTFIAGGYANPAAGSLSADLTVAFVAFLVWLPAEARRVGVRHWWIYAVLSCTVAFAFAYPLFLFVRERKLAAQAA